MENVFWLASHLPGILSVFVVCGERAGQLCSAPLPVIEPRQDQDASKERQEPNDAALVAAFDNRHRARNNRINDNRGNNHDTESGQSRGATPPQERRENGDQYE